MDLRSVAPPSSAASRASRRWTPPRRCSSPRLPRQMSSRYEPSTNGARRGPTLYAFDAPVTGKRQVARGTFVVGMRAPEIAAAVRAGQFVNLGWPGGPLLRRPFSVYRAEGEHIEIVLKAVGAGTAQLLAVELGDRLSCLGPLGRGFDFGKGGRHAVLVSGGLGVAQVAVETYMGCGTGVCLGCAIPLQRGGYDRACKEGPVYRAADVDWPALPSHLPYAVTI